MSRTRFCAVLVLVAVAAVIAAAIAARTDVPDRIGEILLRVRIRLAVERLVVLLDRQHRPSARFTALGVTGTRAAMRGEETRDLLLDASAEQVVELASRSSSPEAVSSAAVGLIARHRIREATELLEDATRRLPREPRLWSDLAAVHLEANRALEALVAADHALRLDDRNADALHNKGLALERIGVPAAAAAAWRRCSEVASDAELASVARQHLSRIESAPSERERWSRVQRELVTGDIAAVERIATDFPMLTRRTAEMMYLGDWAVAFAAGDAATSTAKLRLARAVGSALRRRGETLLAEAVAAIDEAAAGEDTARLQRLAAGHRAYVKGRNSYKDYRYEDAKNELAQAADSFAAARSPMSGVARRYIASALTDQSEIDRAAEILAPLVAAARPGHRAHLADCEYALARCDLFRGRWDRAVEGGSRSAEHSRAGGELAKAALSDALVAAALDVVGQRERGWEKRLDALRMTSATDTPDAVLVIVASGSRAADRARDFDLEASLLDVELTLAELVRIPMLSAELHTRRARVQHELDADADCEVSLARARIATGEVKDEKDRVRLTIEADAAEALAHADQPTRAIDLLTRAVSYCRDRDRRLFLPELLLQRGRAHHAAGDEAAAANDFNAGIDEVDAQRTAMLDSSLRARIFDAAENLFDGAIGLEAGRGNAAAAFALAERSRARALLDLRDAAAKPVASPAEVASRLDRDTLLLEFAVLPDRVLVFSIRGGGVLHMVSVTMERNNASQCVAPQCVDKLLTAVKDDLRPVSKVVLVPEKELQRVPFARYLVRTHVLSVAPSASVLIAGGHEKRKRTSILVVGNPAGDEKGDLAALPEVGQEVDALRGLYGDAHVLFGTEATKARFIAEAPRYDAIHFAGHGLSDDDALTASLLFARDGTDSGRLYLDDIARLRLPRAPLVVLSACGTLRGRASGMEGMPSVARSFLEAGASTVVGTLADVGDAQTARLLGGFHRHLASGASPAEALRYAQLEAIARGGKSAMQKDWASFVVYTTVP